MTKSHVLSPFHEDAISFTTLILLLSLALSLKPLLVGEQWILIRHLCLCAKFLTLTAGITHGASYPPASYPSTSRKTEPSGRGIFQRETPVQSEADSHHRLLQRNISGIQGTLSPLLTLTHHCVTESKADVYIRWLGEKGCISLVSCFSTLDRL